MTRINSHQVIQMVGDDQLVFCEDYGGVEVVLPIADMPVMLSKWHLCAVTAGDAFGPDPIVFVPSDFKAVKQAVDYFIECSKVPLNEQLAAITVTEVSSLADLRALLHGEESS